jgi:hypothetical protein
MNVIALSPGRDDLLRRTGERLDALRRSKQCVRIAALACSASTNGSDTAVRARLARMLLGSVSSEGSGQLILCASGWARHDDLRQELLTLAGALTAELHGATTTVSLRFTDPSYGIQSRRQAIGQSPRVPP